MNNWYFIKDLNDFIEQTRTLVYNNFASNNDGEDNPIGLSEDLSDSERLELDSVLSFDESMVITKTFAKKQRNKKTQEIRYAISDNIFLEIVSSMNSRMVSNIIHGLVRKGLLESAYDADANDFIFWVKDNENQDSKESEAN